MQVEVCDSESVLELNETSKVYSKATCEIRKQVRKDKIHF